MPEWLNGLTWKVSVPDKGTVGSNPTDSADDEIAETLAAVLVFLFDHKCLNRRGKRLLIGVAADFQRRKGNSTV